MMRCKDAAALARLQVDMQHRFQPYESILIFGAPGEPKRCPAANVGLIRTGGASNLTDRNDCVN